ncbi:MAG TPA: hypothetical protein VFH63_09155 [candidate division Zixibacteria bacterium]|nr:hypothetical protein [candidate division Zixibacteria bacterium]
MRFLITPLIVLAVALAACDLGATTPSEQPIPTIQGDSESGSPSQVGSAETSSSASASESADASASAGAEGSATAMSCDEAVAEIEDDLSSIDSVDDLETLADDLGDELDDTITACDSVQEWEDAVGAVAPGISLTDVESFLDQRCDDNDRIDDTPICEEVAG